MSYQKNILSDQIKRILEDLSGDSAEASSNNTGNIEIQPDGFFPPGSVGFTSRYKKLNLKKKKKKDEAIKK